MVEQADPNKSRLQAVDEAMLTPLVRQSLDHQTLTVTKESFKIKLPIFEDK